MSTVKYLPKYGKFHSSWRCCWQQKIDHRDHKVINTYSIGIRLLEVSKVKALESIFFSFFFLLSWPLFFGPPSFLLAKLVSGRKIIGFPYHVYGKSYWASSFFPWSKNRRKNVPCGLASFLVHVWTNGHISQVSRNLMIVLVGNVMLVENIVDHYQQVLR